MREVFDLLDDADIMINIELKTGIVFYPGMAEKLLKIDQRNADSPDRVIYSSFNHYTIKHMREIHHLRRRPSFSSMLTEQSVCLLMR